MSGRGEPLLRPPPHLPGLEGTLANAAALVVAHNHPSGSIEPSVEDVRVTRQLVEAGRVMGVPVHDHLIVGFDGAFTSLKARGLMP